MSIAVSVLLLPSPRLRLLLACFAAAQLGVGFALCVDGAAGPWLGAACMLAGTLLARRAARRPTLRRIDISGLGELRLTVQQTAGQAEWHDAGAAVLTLLPASTLWPQLLVLLLADGKGAIDVLAVLPDSVAPGAGFRTLAVALRHVAARDREFFKTTKIA